MALEKICTQLAILWARYAYDWEFSAYRFWRSKMPDFNHVHNIPFLIFCVRSTNKLNCMSRYHHFYLVRGAFNPLWWRMVGYHGVSKSDSDCCVPCFSASEWHDSHAYRHQSSWNANQFIISIEHYKWNPRWYDRNRWRDFNDQICLLAHFQALWKTKNCCIEWLIAQNFLTNWYHNDWHDSELRAIAQSKKCE